MRGDVDDGRLLETTGETAIDRHLLNMMMSPART